jgi:hypothetical protein
MNMLRITETDASAGRLTLRIEGWIVADSVGELERECQEQLRCGKRVRLDLSRVVYVDAHSAEILRRMTTGEVTIVNQSALIDDLLREGRSR